MDRGERGDHVRRDHRGDDEPPARARAEPLEALEGRVREVVMSRFASFTAADVVAGLLDKGVAQAVLVPPKQPYGDGVMQTLIDDPAEAPSAEPLAPVVPASSATLLAKLTRKGGHPRLAAFLRPSGSVTRMDEGC